MPGGLTGQTLLDQQLAVATLVVADAVNTTPVGAQQSEDATWDVPVLPENVTTSGTSTCPDPSSKDAPPSNVGS